MVSRSPDGQGELSYLLSYLGSERAGAESVVDQEERISYSGRFPTMEEVESYFYSEALKKAQQNQSEAARLLGISQSTLSRWLKRRRGGE